MEESIDKKRKSVEGESSKMEDSEAKRKKVTEGIKGREGNPFPALPKPKLSLRLTTPIIVTQSAMSPLGRTPPLVMDVVASPEDHTSFLVTEKLKNTQAIRNEKQGMVEFRVVVNDGSDEAMILLTGLKNIYQKQLPNMPKEYIARLVYDKTHGSMAVVRKPLTVLGGITYRAFMERNFAEIVFCAIASTEQVQGYGSRLMSHVKDHVREDFNIWNFLTYADNYAIGYFKKQGFTTDITLDRKLWVGYIKDYEGGTLMQCTMVPKIKYLDVVNTIVAHRLAVFKHIKDASRSAIVYPGLVFERESIDPATIPGLKEAGWFPGLTSTRPPPRQRGPLYIFMKKMVTELKVKKKQLLYATSLTTTLFYKL